MIEKDNIFCKIKGLYAMQTGSVEAWNEYFRAKEDAPIIERMAREEEREL